MKRISLTKLFFIFFKIGAVLFGGGYAILPFLRSEIVDKAQICSMEEVTDFYALSQCFPGLVAGNVCMFVGYKARGILGALAAVVGVCSPAFISIVAVFSFISVVVKYPLVQNIFEILDLAVCVLIYLTIMELWEHSVFDKFTTFIFITAVILSAKFNISPFIIVISAGILGLLRFMLFPKDIKSSKKKQEEGEKDA